ncbi:HpcH/HpaI aldolase/citrate lyase family protein [Xanthobacter agilis]|uniref:Citrate lyase subunit beta/citryl-CoA lyase n=1 Tax=Xanthobacter agilis TaxID=47492 RepID=A0ABU0L883_XANAG|nr:CoA ester lyase [Xanthobacter agilis]MDQ0503364.1 citrate lyase subunit beta/citryl-CoA lyase [Xanthobacter agilis]
MTVPPHPTPLRRGRLVALFVPATRPERFAKAAAAGADAVIIDLEDAVAQAEKDAARSAVATAALPTGVPLLLRINGVETPWHADDIDLARRLPLAGVMLAKAEHAADVARVAARLGETSLVPLIESARGLGQARAIAALPQVARLAFGSIDFAADLGCAHTRQALLAARAELVLAARLAGREGPMDGVTTALTDPALAQDDAAHAVELGFAGKLVIHPGQIAPVMAGFAPSPEEIAWARQIVGALTAGGAVVSVNGTMVDAPVRLRAERILARA